MMCARPVRVRARVRSAVYPDLESNRQGHAVADVCRRSVFRFHDLGILTDGASVPSAPGLNRLLAESRTRVSSFGGSRRHPLDHEEGRGHGPPGPSRTDRVPTSAARAQPLTTITWRSLVTTSTRSN
jgi:hypothetical protein